MHDTTQDEPGTGTVDLAALVGKLIEDLAAARAMAAAAIERLAWFEAAAPWAPRIRQAVRLTSPCSVSARPRRAR